MKIKIFLFILLSFQVYSQCGYTLAYNNISVTWNGEEIDQENSLELSRTNNSSSCRDFFITFSTGNSSNYSRFTQHASFSDQQSYNLYKRSRERGLLRDKNDVTNNNQFLKGKLPNNVNRTRESTFNFFLGQIASIASQRGGIYEDNISINVYNGDINGSHTLELTVNLNIIIIITKQIQISLVEANGAFDENDTSQNLNFGELNQGDSNQFDMIVKSNAGYQIFYSSLNNGQLSSGTGSSRKVDYDLRVDGVLKNLANSQTTPVEVSLGSGVTNTAGDRKNVTLTIGQTSGKSSGSYTDTILITAQTSE